MTAATPLVPQSRARRILVLTFYHPPDLAAGSFRVAALVQALRAQAPDAEIDIITTLPNRYRTFAADAPARSTEDGVTIDRIALPTHRSGMLDQAKAFVAYSRAVLRLVRGRHYDVVFATSSRLMTAALGAWVARRVHAGLYIDLRDIFVDTIADVLGGVRAVVLRPAVSALERWTVGRAARVNLVSRGFASWFEARYPTARFSWFTNGVDDEFVAAAATERAPAEGGNGVIRVLYAGNIGEGQGLHRILPALAIKLRGEATFRVIGDGGRRAQLVEALAAVGADNVELVAPLSREALRAEYAAASVLFLHLNDYEAFLKVLPSKIFEYAATGKPLWAGVAGHAAEFLRTEVVNAAVFDPCNVDAAVSSLRGLEIVDRPRDAFVARFARANIMRAMAADVLAVADAPSRERAP